MPGFTLPALRPSSCVASAIRTVVAASLSARSCHRRAGARRGPAVHVLQGPRSDHPQTWRGWGKPLGPWSLATDDYALCFGGVPLPGRPVSVPACFSRCKTCTLSLPLRAPDFPHRPQTPLGENGVEAWGALLAPRPRSPSVARGGLSPGTPQSQGRFAPHCASGCPGTWGWRKGVRDLGGGRGPAGPTPRRLRILRRRPSRERARRSGRRRLGTGCGPARPRLPPQPHLLPAAPPAPPARRCNRGGRGVGAWG